MPYDTTPPIAHQEKIMSRTKFRHPPESTSGDIGANRQKAKKGKSKNVSREAAKNAKEKR